MSYFKSTLLYIYARLPARDPLSDKAKYAMAFVSRNSLKINLSPNEPNKVIYNELS